MLELGCGTGRLTIPVARAGAEVVGIDRSEPMLARARQRLRRARARALLLRGDIRHLPFRRRTRFAMVMAPYGMLQSLTSERDLQATLAARPRRAAARRPVRIDLVPDLPRWSEYDRRVSLSRLAAAAVTSPSRNRSARIARKGLTIFDQEYQERRGGEEDGEPFLADVPDHFRSRRCAAVSRRQAFASTRCSATTRAVRSTCVPTSGSFSRGGPKTRARKGGSTGKASARCAPFTHSREPSSGNV